MNAPIQTGYTALSDPDQRGARSFVAFFVSAGLLNALIAAILLCRLPESHAPSLGTLFVRAAIYVLLGAVAGVGGAWFYWKRSSTFAASRPVSFSLFALICAAGWVWVPSAVLLFAQDSSAAAAVAAIAGAILATGLRRTIPLAADPFREPWSASDPAKELFADSLFTVPRRPYGYIIAISIYAAAYALHDRSILTATALLAFSAFIFASKSALPASGRPDYAQNRRAAMRLARIAVPAVLITLWALLDGVAHRNNSDAAGAAFAGGTDSSKRVVNVPNPALSADGYESIVLWPLPEKKQIIPPLPPPSTLLAPGTSQPLIIRFDGPYLYFQPGRRPGTTAHQAQGSPLAVHIQSTNAIPLTIEAHQSLGTAIRLARCREIQVAIANRDNAPGAVALAILLTDSTAPGKPTLYLGQQPLETTQPDRFLIKSAPAYESLRFAVPAHASIRKFDEITVMLLPDIEHALVGPRIAIQQFQLYPR